MLPGQSEDYILPSNIFRVFIRKNLQCSFVSVFKVPMENEIPTAVSTKIDEETGRALVLIEKAMEIKPAAVARLGLKAVLPDLIKRAKQIAAASK